jgi:hypothetical protein
VVEFPGIDLELGKKKKPEELGMKPPEMGLKLEPQRKPESEQLEGPRVSRSRLFQDAGAAAEEARSNVGSCGNTTRPWI